MPVHDWECRACGYQILDRYQPRLDSSAPLCVYAYLQGVLVPGHKMERLWSTSNAVKFREFDVDVPGLGQRHISDIHQLRRVEREAAAVGRPWAIRQYTQNNSNRDRNVFRHLQPAQRVKKQMRRGRPVVTVGHYEGD